MLNFSQQNYFDNYPTLSILDIPTSKELNRGLNSRIINENEMFLFAAADYVNIYINTSFNIIIPSRNIENSIESHTILKYVSVNPSYEIDYLPKGYSGICIFEFPNGKPDILNKLAVYGEKKDFSQHDTLILTHIKILDLIKKEIQL